MSAYKPAPHYGDVFRLRGQEPLYVVEALGQNGVIYARRYDLYVGARGAPLLLAADSAVEVLFSALPCPEEEGWLFCEIEHRVQYEAGEAGIEWFEARGVGPGGGFRAGRSRPRPFFDGEPLLAAYTAANRAIHRRLVEELMRAGWQPLVEPRAAWYAMRLRHKMEG